MEALASRAKTLCLRRKFGRAAKVFSSQGIAYKNNKINLEKLHPREIEVLDLMEDCNWELFPINMSLK